VLYLAGDSVAVIAGLERILTGIRTSFVALLLTPSSYPEAMRVCVEPNAGLQVQVRRVVKVNAIGRGMNIQGFELSGIALYRRSDLGLLGEDMSRGTAFAIFAGIALSKVNLVQIATEPDSATPNASLEVPSFEMVDTAGPGKVDLAMQYNWTARVSIPIGTLAGDS
tara:strand:+ start:135 stop:635 length:501 start_codon:yes stop_codon:yes gene_type:complete